MIKTYKQLQEDWLYSTKVDFNNIDQKTKTEWHVSIINETTLLISFQGSKGILDWLYNFDFFVKPYHNMKHLFLVHRGFLKKYKAVQTRIHKTIDEFRPKKLLLRGFSQGAAIALICKEDIWFNYGEIAIDTVVFGSPQVFTLVNKSILEERLKDAIRVEYEGDLVTYVPSILLGFWSYGKKIRIGDKKLIGSPTGHKYYDHYFKGV